MSALPAVTRDKDQSLSAALSGMVESHETSLRLGDHDPHVATVRRLPAEPARYAPFPDATDPRLREALAKRGIEQLYTHQAAAIDYALAHKNTVVITPTASGKTLCYNAPVLQSIRRTRRHVRCICFRRKRSRRISWRNCSSWWS